MIFYSESKIKSIRYKSKDRTFRYLYGSTWARLDVCVRVTSLSAPVGCVASGSVLSCAVADALLKW